jgi:hypothetical protein
MICQILKYVLYLYGYYVPKILSKNRLPGVMGMGYMWERFGINRFIQGF